jgi:hypothetical protein
MNFLLDQVFAQLIPIILTALSAILTTVLVRGSGIIKERWGIEIEADDFAVETPIMALVDQNIITVDQALEVPNAWHNRNPRGT